VCLLRRTPRSRANIDHLLISSAGVFVVDAKRYKGKVERRDSGGFFRTDYRLYVGGRDRSKLVVHLESQVRTVRQALNGTVVPAVIPVLCFVDSEWGLFTSPLRFGDVRVLWPKMLGKLVRSKGHLTAAEISAVERQLAHALPPA
jgi:Nuclease-related domain